MTPNVIDISHHNEVGGSGPALAGFQEAGAAGVLAVIHKATQGTDYTDPMYARRRQPALDAGLLWGCYHFGNSSDVARQVDHFLAAAKPDDRTLVALDWEYTIKPDGEIDWGQTMLREPARQFLDLLGRLIGRKPVLYSGNLAKEQLGQHADPFFGSHPLWLAQYGPRWTTQASWTKPLIWQFAEKGAVPGISGAVDHNHYSGTLEQLTAEWAA